VNLPGKMEERTATIIDVDVNDLPTGTSTTKRGADVCFFQNPLYSNSGASKLSVDVKIVHTETNVSQFKGTKQQLSEKEFSNCAVNKGDQTKHGKAREAQMQLNGYDNSSFTLDIYGGTHASAALLLKELAKREAQAGFWNGRTKALLRSWYVQLSTALYRVYAEELISRVQMLRTMDKVQGQVFRGHVLNFIGPAIAEIRIGDFMIEA
jgi:hypothetical protein